MTHPDGAPLFAHPPMAGAQRRCARAAHGLTLVELLTAIALLAVLLGIGVPSFASLLQRWRVDAAVESLTADIRLARSTATRTSRPVVMCARASDGTCSAGNDWSTGWLVFSDPNDDLVFDKGEPLIVERQAPPGIAAMVNESKPARLAFRANGTLQSGRTSVAIRPGQAARASTAVTINAMGRARVQTLD